MKKILIIFWIIIVQNIHLLAEPVDSAEAKIIAAKYYSEINPNLKDNAIKKTIAHNYKKTITRYTFVFENNDFVVVSGDNATVPIFAYSNKNSFSEDNNPTIELWMQCEYDELVNYVQSNGIDNKATIHLWDNIKNKKIMKDSHTKGVSPLISSQWGQAYTNDGYCPGFNYYVTDNSECGCNKCTAGCVAVAMAQIMRFWRYPADNFDWCKMPDLLIQQDANLPPPHIRPEYERERNAIANLIHNCGVKADMEYCSNGCGSSSTIGKAKRALQNDFYFHKDMLHRLRTYTINWKNKMRESLNNGNPILYGGNNTNGSGHAFICDGYSANDDNFFHFNWGWRGSNDGYYYIDNDDGSPVIEYKRWQEAVFYIHPDGSTKYCIDCNEIINVQNAIIGTLPVYPDLPNIYWSGIHILYNLIPMHSIIKPEYSNVIYVNGEYRLQYFPIGAGTINLENSNIPDKVNSFFYGYNEITIKNTTIAAGSVFEASIIPCPDVMDKKRIKIEKGHNFDTLSKTDKYFSNIKIDYLNNFIIFPNPSNGDLTIHFKNPNEISNIQLTDQFNKILIFQKEVAAINTLNINYLSKGIYFLHIETKERKFVEKIILQ